MTDLRVVGGDLLPPANEKRNLLSISDLSQEDIERLLSTARSFAHSQERDGKHQHPTQALLDLYTMREAFGRLDGLQVAIVGDSAHSRVARSLVQALRLVGADAILVGPPALLPEGLASTSHDITSIADADV